MTWRPTRWRKRRDPPEDVRGAETPHHSRRGCGAPGSPAAADRGARHRRCPCRGGGHRGRAGQRAGAHRRARRPTDRHQRHPAPRLRDRGDRRSGRGHDPAQPDRDRSRRPEPDHRSRRARQGDRHPGPLVPALPARDPGTGRLAVDQPAARWRGRRRVEHRDQRYPTELPALRPGCRASGGASPRSSTMPASAPIPHLEVPHSPDGCSSPRTGRSPRGSAASWT